MRSKEITLVCTDFIKADEQSFSNYRIMYKANKLRLEVIGKYDGSKVKRKHDDY